MYKTPRFLESKRLVDKVVAKCKAEGLRVFLSDEGEGNYGFFTDKNGQKVVCFDTEPWLLLRFFTAHTSKPGYNEGSGIMIEDEVADVKSLNLTQMLEVNKETDGHKPKTLEDELKAYGQSSKYKEV